MLKAPRSLNPGQSSLTGKDEILSPLSLWSSRLQSMESDTTERLHFHFSLSCIGEGNGNPLQYSCLENPWDRGAWWVAIYGVAQSQTRLKWLSSSSSSRHAYTGFCHSGKKNIYILQIFRTLFYTYYVIFTMILWHEFSIFPNIFLQRLF